MDVSQQITLSCLLQQTFTCLLGPNGWSAGQIDILGMSLSHGFQIHCGLICQLTALVYWYYVYGI